VFSCAARIVIINPTAVDAYIAKKRLTPQVSDSEWKTILQRVAALFGRELWHRCRLIHQAEDAHRRYSTTFPDAIPQPYRYIHNLELIVFPSPQLSQLQQWLTGRGVVWRECHQFDVDTEQDQIVGLQIFGYEPDHAA
jgi:hypothetical protein